MCAENSGAFSVIAPPLIPTERDGHLHFTIDFEAFESAITPETKVFLLCSPHNPVGARVDARRTHPVSRHLSTP
ncbi:MAG UNVERIFIED_CONTAM: aminotransferase class I/II-fold pyridoxal phosphate-dependent enzyme [Anaerolineae bacterium]